MAGLDFAAVIVSASVLSGNKAAQGGGGGLAMLEVCHLFQPMQRFSQYHVHLTVCQIAVDFLYPVPTSRPSRSIHLKMPHPRPPTFPRFSLPSSPLPPLWTAPRSTRLCRCCRRCVRAARTAAVTAWVSDRETGGRGTIYPLLALEKQIRANF